MSASVPIKILVCNTIKELAEYRRIAMETLQRLGCDTLIAEQELLSNTNAVLDALSLVDKADVFVGIFGFRYGYVPRTNNPDSLSISELQYRRAVERGIPILIYLAGERLPLPKTGTLEPLSETTLAYRQKIKVLRQELASRHTVTYFESQTGLAEAVTRAIHAGGFQQSTPIAAQVVEETPTLSGHGDDISGTGGSHSAIADFDAESPASVTAPAAPLVEALPAEPEAPPPAPRMPSPLTMPTIPPPAIGAIPTRPSPFIAHTFAEPLKLFGRQADLNWLSTWQTAPESVLVLDGPGGIGKSALAWYWLHTQDTSAWAGILWWSFAEADSTYRNFVRRALAYVAGQPLDAVDQLAPPIREQALLKALRERPFLLVFDDVERLLGAWHQHEAPFWSESHIEQTLNAGNKALLKCADPGIGAFLVRLAASEPSKTLLISRTLPADYYDPDDKLLSGVQCYSLGGLETFDGLLLLRELGVQGDENALKALSAQIEGHPLLLSLLAGQIGNTFPVRGDYETWYREGGYRLGLSDLPLVARRSAVMNHVLTGLPSDVSKTLLQISAFRNGIDIAAIIATLPFVPPKPAKMIEPRRWQADYGEAKNRWDDYRQMLKDIEADRRAARPRLDAALNELIERRLLLKDRYIQRYTVHPVVRSAALARAKPEDRMAAFLRIRDYAEQLPSDIIDRARDLSNLSSSLELYRALISAGQFDEAAAVYRANIGKAPLAQIASHYQVIELLRPLFPSGTGSMPALMGLRERGYFANEMAMALGSIGQRVEALNQLGQAFGPFAEERSAPHLCAALLNYAGLMRDDHQLAAKAHVFELARALAAAAGETESLATARLFLLKIYADTGQFDLAAQLYDEFTRNLPQLRTAYRRATAERMYAKMRVYQQQDPTAALNLALQLALESGSPHEQLAVYALWGETGLQQNRPDAAEKFFSEALAMALRTGVQIDNYAGGLARALARQNRLDEARALLAKGVSRAAAAEVYLELGEREKAKQFALDAYRAAWADGPPFSYWLELENAKRVLNALDVLPPLLPFYEPGVLKPLPFEAEIRAFIQELRTNAG